MPLADIYETVIEESGEQTEGGKTFQMLSAPSQGTPGSLREEKSVCFSKFTAIRNLSKICLD